MVRVPSKPFSKSKRAPKGWYAERGAYPFLKEAIRQTRTKKWGKSRAGEPFEAGIVAIIAFKAMSDLFDLPAQMSALRRSQLKKAFQNYAIAKVMERNPATPESKKSIHAIQTQNLEAAAAILRASRIDSKSFFTEMNKIISHF